MKYNLSFFIFILLIMFCNSCNKQSNEHKMNYEPIKVGELRASSYARIIDKKGNNFLVQIPSDSIAGWLNKKHVKSIVKKNPKTRKLCNEKSVNNNNDFENCVEYVALWSAADIAKQIGKTKKWVFMNYRVDIWDIPKR